MAEKITAKDLTEGIAGWKEAEMLGQFENFLKKVEDDGYIIVPTMSNFADYIDKSRADVHEWARLHPTARAQMRDMCADTIASGAMLKKYVPNVTNFALKNMCGWEEAPQKKTSNSKSKTDEKTAKAMLEEYTAQERRNALRLAK